MPRESRRKSDSGIYHIMLRGINKQIIFEDDMDKRRFLETIEKYKQISHFKLYAYCLMDNHVHLLLEESEERISEVIKRISSSYVYWYNLKYERCGHLFQDRFKSENVETIRYFLTVLRYIHQNPLKAGLVSNVFESKWTSIYDYVNNKADLVDIDKALDLFSADRRKAIQMFIAYMQQANEDQCLDNQTQIRLQDSQVNEYLHSLGVHNSSDLQQMTKVERDLILVRLKKLRGTSVRQISRITGISKSVIDRAR
ncbi:transposase [Mesobacillus maritimus]|uniref:transposase n=1 Tax=Mesobacillus maritimus TaxID=1643336 RepID=UPI00203A5B40|nr:transposase [Mesobacillus maritimus]MCM3588875.1 transposase [Mesobacillus maritimus]